MILFFYVNAPQIYFKHINFKFTIVVLSHDIATKIFAYQQIIAVSSYNFTISVTANFSGLRLSLSLKVNH